MKHLSLSILLLFLIYGCGTRKTDQTRTETKTEAFNIENNYSSGTKIVLGSNFSYTPFDPSKPMVIEGKSYQNAVVKSEKKASIEKHLKITEKIVVHTSRNILTTKSTTRTDHTFLWLGIVFIVLFFVLLYVVLKKWGVV